MAICRGNNYNSECVLQVFAKNIDGLNYENDQNLFPACDCLLLPPANEVWGKVIFLHLSVIVFTGGVPGQVHPRLGDTGNKRAVRILLECILVK